MIDATNSLQLPSEHDSTTAQSRTNRAFGRNLQLETGLLFNDLFQAQLFQSRNQSPESPDITQSNPSSTVQQSRSQQETTQAVDEEQSDEEQDDDLTLHCNELCYLAPQQVIAPEGPAVESEGAELVTPVLAADNVSTEELSNRVANTSEESTSPDLQSIANPAEATTEAEIVSPGEVVLSLPVENDVKEIKGDESVEITVPSPGKPVKKPARDKSESEIHTPTERIINEVAADTPANDTPAAPVLSKQEVAEDQSQPSKQVPNSEFAIEAEQPQEGRRAKALADKRTEKNDRDGESSEDAEAIQAVSSSEATTHDPTQISVPEPIATVATAELTPLSQPSIIDVARPDAQNIAASIAVAGKVSEAAAATTQPATSVKLSGAGPVVNAPAGRTSNGIPSSGAGRGTTGASPVPESHLTQYQQTRLLQRVMQGLEKLQDGTSTVSLRLHPPELGALQVSLQMSTTTVNAVITVESEAAKQVLQENLPMLQSKLADQGLQVERFQIQTQSPQDNAYNAFNQDQAGSSNSRDPQQQQQDRQDIVERLQNRLRTAPTLGVRTQAMPQGLDVTV